MDSTVSVSKGCFVFKNKNDSKKSSQISPLQSFTRDVWYQMYKQSWYKVEDSLKSIEDKVFSTVLHGLINYMKVCDSQPSGSENEIPAATLLTGINMPDHGSLFASLSSQIASEVSPHVVTLWSRDCTTLRATVERMCGHFMSAGDVEDADCEDEEDSDGEVKARSDHRSGIQRWQCNMPYLNSWYNQLWKAQPSPSKSKKRRKSETFHGGAGKQLVVIIPDLESFPSKVLQDFVLILSGYRNRLPFVLILGVATAVSAVHRSLPHHVSSRVRMQLFHAQPSCKYLNDILDEVFLTPQRTVHLGGKTFELLTNVFLYYDFSVTGFTQAYKFCMSEHYFDKNWTMLSCSPADLPAAVEQLSKSDIESIRKLPSIRKYIESLRDKSKMIAWIKDDKFVKTEIQRLLLELHSYISAFYAALRCLHIFTSSLPKAPLGKHLWSLYSSAVLSDLNQSSSLKESLTLLGFLSSEELQMKLEKAVQLLQETASEQTPQLVDIAEDFEEVQLELQLLIASGNQYATPTKSPTKCTPSKNSPSPLKSPSKLHMSTSTSRAQFKEKLKESTENQRQKRSEFESLRDRFLNILSEKLCADLLVPPNTKPLHEVLFFDDVAAVKPHIIGSPRQAVLRALKDPHYYLECSCCGLSDPDDIPPTLPDVSIVYKLHLESGKLINMYDWLQSFLTIVNPSDGEEQTEVDPMLQARFTQAVAELQFLGFIKSSNRKTDHVTRLTWS